STHGRDVPISVSFETTSRTSVVRSNILDLNSASGSAGTSSHRVNADLVFTPSFPTATTFATWQAAGSTSSIFLGDNSLFPGEVVHYPTSGPPMGGLVTNGYSFVPEPADRLSIQLATRDAQGNLQVVTLDPSMSSTYTQHLLTPPDHIVGSATADIYLDL